MVIALHLDGFRLELRIVDGQPIMAFNRELVKVVGLDRTQVLQRKVINDALPSLWLGDI
ncbi:hypothetical protein ACTXO0_11190 [Glutamicibacter ardleyensis]|uniref:hypothetical protein n=1 Tax=Glutamicibacter ardleyensis TaxID=225894 RepID=UPI003FD0B292